MPADLDVVSWSDDRRLRTIASVVTLTAHQPGFHALVRARGAAPALVAHELRRRTGCVVLYVAPDSDAALHARADLDALAQGLLGKPTPGRALLVAASETTPFANVHPDRRTLMQRAAALFALGLGEDVAFAVATPASLLRKVAPRAIVLGAGRRVALGERVDLRELAQSLAIAGYLRVPIVEDAGSFALRGGLCDAWPPLAELPLRIELDGDIVSRIRSFDPDDQVTENDVEHVWLPPAREVVTSDVNVERAEQVVRSLADAVNHPSKKARALAEDVASGRLFFGAEAYLPAFYELASVLDYLPPGAPIVVEDPAGVVKALERERQHAERDRAHHDETPHFPTGDVYLDPEALAAALETHPTLTTAEAGVASAGAETALERLEATPIDAIALAIDSQSSLGAALKAERSNGRQGALGPLVERIAAWREARLDVVVTGRSLRQCERLAALLTHRKLGVEGDVGAEILPTAAGADVRLAISPLARGAVAPAEGFVLLTEEEIFGERTHRATAQKKKSPRAVLEDLKALAVGDYVVHVEHGIGRYEGLERRTIGGIHLELLVVSYQGGDKLYVPVYRLNQIQKYAGGDAAPKLSRLGGQTFAETKARTRRRVRILADHLLELYAERAALKRPALPPADDDYAAFEATFPYEETRDQAAAIDDVLADLHADRVMDRLVCGDVGFGKTEVALRAAFQSAIAGRQVALLCPTTVLAQQHFLTFATRFADYPLVVRTLSRFQSKAEIAATLTGLKNGSVDVVVGTHRVLSKDVHFKNLGLLVVDEEQRFGVAHKERIKQLKTSVDVLTLSATPIPRTLQMALGGLRDLSIISTPPADRRAIRTITSRWDPELVTEAIEQELARGGQIFYVYNRIEGLEERAAALHRLMPSLRIGVVHGREHEDTLERTMLRFLRGETDVLVTTAIIESGLDIPRANTMLIERADMFGLSQLYQLRGRIGRSSERAYCYLLVPPASQLTDEARKRIEALERHGDLGSGMHIATLDLELRGAGDLLGADQSGFVAGVGLEMFSQMLSEATAELRGESVSHDVDPELSLDVEALLPEDYVEEVAVRLSLYKRLASAADEAEVDAIAGEIEDRFGPPPTVARRLVELMRIKTELRRLRVLGCEASKKSVTLHLREDTPLDPSRLATTLADENTTYRLSPDGKLTRRARDGDHFDNGLSHVDQMLDELGALVRDQPA